MPSPASIASAPAPAMTTFVPLSSVMISASPTPDSVVSARASVPSPKNVARPVSESTVFVPPPAVIVSAPRPVITVLVPAPSSTVSAAPLVSPIRPVISFTLPVKFVNVNEPLSLSTMPTPGVPPASTRIVSAPLPPITAFVPGPSVIVSAAPVPGSIDSMVVSVGPTVIRPVSPIT